MQVLYKFGLILVWLVLMVLATVVPTLADSTLPSYTASPSATRPRVVTPTPAGAVVSPTPSVSEAKGGLYCEELKVNYSEGRRAPVKVELQVEYGGGDSQGYRFHLGDGTVKEADENRFSHRYETGGAYAVMAEVKDAAGAWHTSEACVARVELTTAITASDRAGCGGVSVILGQDSVAPARVRVRVSGFDNRGEIGKYRVDFGDGSEEVELDGAEFEYEYVGAGTYAVKGQVRDSRGEWHGEGDASCQTTVRVLTKPLEVQPETGAPLGVLVLSGLSGVMGVGLWKVRGLVN